MMEEQGEVLLFIQDHISGSAKQREAGMVNQFQTQYPNIQVGGVYYMDELEGLKEDTAAKLEKEAGEITDEEVLRQIFADHPDAKGCIAANEETAEMVIDACETAERDDIRIIGFDGGETLTEALSDGKIDGLIVQNPYAMGYLGVETAANLMNGQTGGPSVVDTATTIVTRENMYERRVRRYCFFEEEVIDPVQILR